jgi:quercetin dioxygenase-like cupin family protein
VDHFEYLRNVDWERLRATPATERVTQRLLDPSSGAANCTFAVIRTPPGGASPEGLHVHEVEQLVYVLDGTLSVDVDGRRLSVEPGGLVVLPPQVPHRVANEAHEPSLHIAINAPAPDPRQPRARRVEAGDASEARAR